MSAAWAITSAFTAGAITGDHYDAIERRLGSTRARLLFWVVSLAVIATLAGRVQ